MYACTCKCMHAYEQAPMGVWIYGCMRICVCISVSGTLRAPMCAPQACCSSGQHRLEEALEACTPIWSRRRWKPAHPYGRGGVGILHTHMLGWTDTSRIRIYTYIHENIYTQVANSPRSGVVDRVSDWHWGRKVEAVPWHCQRIEPTQGQQVCTGTHGRAHIHPHTYTCFYLLNCLILARCIEVGRCIIQR